MQVTISTHNGSQSHRAHNIRKDYVVNKQEHIDITKSNLNEILYDEEPHKAYNRIFGQSLKEYNAKQKRPERRIKDYYTVIKRDKKKHTVYEMIIQVGGKDNKIDISTHKAILKEFYTEWSVRNPQLECIGAYIHCDEATPHLHLDYVPVAVGYTKGMSIQNGLVKALGLQGFEKAGKETAQIQWERSENKILENICNKYGIEVEHPNIAGIKHMETETYKANAKLADLKAECSEMHLRASNLHENESKVKLSLERQNAKLGQINANIEQQEKQVEILNSDIKTLENKRSAILIEKQQFEKDLKEKQEKLEQAHKRLLQAQKDTETIQSNITILEKEKDALQSNLKQISYTLGTYAEIDNMGKSKLFGKSEILTTELNQLKEQAKAYYTERVKADNAERQLNEVQKALNSYKKDFMLTFKELQSVSKEFKEIKNRLDKMTKVICSDNELKRAYIKQTKILEQKNIENHMQVQDLRNKKKHIL